MWTDAHGPQANLHVRHHLALEPVHENHANRNSCEDQQNVDNYPNQVAGFAWRHIRMQVPQEALDHRSTSPSTMSSVPMMATTSATRLPWAIFASACKLMKDGGRTRTR